MQIVFSTSLGLFVSDGTDAGTVLLAALPDPTGYAGYGPLVPLGDDVLFGYQDGVIYDPPSLGLTDGTTAGTAIFLTLSNEGLEGNGPPGLNDIVSLGDSALFNYSPAGPTLGQTWSTDGTETGTINLSADGVYALNLDPGGLLGGTRLVYAGIDGVDVSDGTAAGSFQLKAAASIETSVYSYHFASLGSIVVFGIESGPDFNAAGGGDQLWRTDGTLAGTTLVTDLPRLSAYAGMTASMSFGSDALFAYDDGALPAVRSLWVTDGTAAGTFQLPGITNPQFGVAANGEAFLIAAEGLVATNGTVAGTHVVMPKSLGPNGFGPTTIMARLGDDVIFAAGTPTNLNDPYVNGPANQLWITDGTSAGTTLIETLPNAIISMTSSGDRVVFTAGDTAGNPAIWTTDGTVAGTSVLIDNAAAYFSTGTVADLPCFAAGTRILTQRGRVRVERLRIGDAVPTVAGSIRTIQWIGHRHVDCRRHPKAREVWPVRIAPHAFGEGRPACALWLSPDHSVFVEGVLIPIKFLVNDETIEQVPVDTITYYHIELERHDILLAEGLPVESYLETGGRHAFADGDSVMQLFPCFTRDEARVTLAWESTAYAPLLGDADQLSRTRMKLALQAGMLCAADARRRKRVGPADGTAAKSGR